MLYYHGTNSVFAQFNIDCDVRPDAASNGHLGIWLAIEKTLAYKFGRYCLAVEVQIGKAYDMPIDELSRMHQHCLKVCPNLDEAEADGFERKFYTEKRLGLLEAGYDFIRVVEVNGRSDMGVCLVAENLSVIGCEPPL